MEKGTVNLCHPRQIELDDFRRRDGDDHDEPATPVQRVDKKNCFEAWRNLSVRNVWIATGKKLSLYGIKGSELQLLLVDRALASDATTLQQITFTGFRGSTYMAEGDNYRLAANMFLPEQIDVKTRAMLAVVEDGVTSEDGVDRISLLEGGVRGPNLPSGLLPQALGKRLLVGQRSPAIFAHRRGFGGVLPQSVLRLGVRRKSGAADDGEHAPRYEASVAGAQRLHPGRGPMAARAPSAAATDSRERR